MHYRRNADYDLRNLERLAAGGDLQAVQKLQAMRLRAGLCVDCGSGLGPCKTALDHNIENCEELVCNKCESCDTSGCQFIRRVNAYLDGVTYFSTGGAGGCPGCDTEDQDEYIVDGADLSFFSWSPCEVCGSHLGGDRYPAHGYLDDELVHFDICLDCISWFDFGDLSDEE